MNHAPTLPTEIRRSRLIFGAGAVAVCLASILAIAAAIECHNAAAVLAPGTTWTPSLLYGAVLWLWWAGVAYLLWHAARRSSSNLPSIGNQPAASDRAGLSRNDAPSGQPALVNALDGVHLVGVAPNRIWGIALF